MFNTAVPQGLISSPPAWQNTTPFPLSAGAPSPAAPTGFQPQILPPPPSGIDRLLTHDDVQACIRASQAEHSGANSVQLVLAICVVLGLLGAGLVFADTARRLHKAKQKAAREHAECHAGDPRHSRMEHVHV
jgi:hypothetical protein